ncbi:unnamed protein product [Arabidopsis halleri]
MESATSAHQQLQLISSFLDITVGQSAEIALQFLKATNWHLEDAINLFLIARRNPNQDQVPLPLPSMMDTLYDSSMCHNTSVSVSPEDIWDSTSEESESDSRLDSTSEESESYSRLSSLYRPPPSLFFHGSFEDAKATSSREDLWLLVYDHTNEGQKISTFYKIDSAPPVVLLIDPITGQKMRMWSGMIEAQGFLEDLMKYMDAGPHEHVASLTSNKRMKTEKISFSSNNADDQVDMATFWGDDIEEEKTLTKDEKEENLVVAPSWGQEFEDIKTLSDHEEETCLSSDLFEFPVLTDEPKGDCDRSVVCSLCVRFPDGRRKQRKFLKSEPIQLLWSFCYSHMEESEKKAFKLVQAIPGASKTLDYGANVTFDHSGLANSMISDADSTTSRTSDDADSEESESRLSSSFPPPLYILQEVNLQSRTELASHTLNRDVWAKDAVSQTIESSCIVWQFYDDTNEGQKVSSFYKIESPPPVVFVINPITGQKMHMWSGVIEADSFVEDLMMFREAGPHENIASLTRNRRTEPTETCSSSNNIYYETPPPSWGEEFEKEDTWSSRNSNNQTPWEKEFDDQDAVETWASSSDTDHFVPPFIGDEYEDSDEAKEDETCLVFPVLTEEPKGDCDRSVVCSLCVRFPDGRRKQRRFLKSEPIQLLWSFCYSHMDESEKRSFKLVQAIPGASKTLDYEADTTFDQSGLANSMISVIWERSFQG